MIVLLATVIGLGGYALWLSSLMGEHWWSTYIWRTYVALAAALAVSDLALVTANGKRARALVRGLSFGASIVLLVALPVLVAIPFLPTILRSPAHAAEACFELFRVLQQPHFLLCITVSRGWLIRALLRDETTAEDDGSWYRGVGLSPAVLFVGLSPAFGSIYVNWHPSPAPAAAAIRSARVVMSCAEVYAARHAGHYPHELGDLARGDSACVTPGLAGADSAGFALGFHGGVQPRLLIRDRTAPLRTYRSYFSDVSGVLFTASYAHRDARPSDYAIGPANNLRVLRGCLERASTLEPRHVPASLWDLSPNRSACSELQFAKWLGDGDTTIAELLISMNDRGSSIDETYRFESHAWLDGRGHVDSIDVSARPADYGRSGIASYLLTWSGEIHATSHDRPATRSDPLVHACDVTSGVPCAPGVSVTVDYRPAAQLARPAVATLVKSDPSWQARLVAPRAERVLISYPLPPLVTVDHSVVVTTTVGTFAYDVHGRRLWARPDLITVNAGASRGPGKTILIVDSSGVLHALAPGGVDTWRVTLGRQPRFPPLWSGKMIFVVSDTVVTAVSARGEIRWTHPFRDYAFGVAAADDGGMYLHRADQLEHLSVNGMRDASAPINSLRPCASDSARRQGPVLSACGDSGFRAVLWPSGDRRLMRFPEESGPQREREVLVSTSAIRDDGTVLDDRDHEPVRVIAPDMSIRWRVPGNPAEVYVNPVAVRSYVACLVSDGRVAWIDENGGEFATTDLGKTGDRFSKLAADADGSVYVLADNGTLFALHAPEKPSPRR